MVSSTALLVCALLCLVSPLVALRGASAVTDGAPAPTATVLAEWGTLEFDWPSDAAKAKAEADGTYIASNCAISGIRYYGGSVYLTTPRWFNGVPSTLNRLITKDGRPVLQPYPSWDMQTEGDYAALQNVQGMEIDSLGRMWILDVGRHDQVSKHPVNGPPKLIVWDMVNNVALRTYVFDDIIGSYSESYLQDLVVDEVNGFAYIADASGSYGGAIVVYHYESNTAWRWHDSSMAATPGYVFTVDGREVKGHTAIDGIALSPDSATLYFTPLQSDLMYSVKTSVLQSPTTTDAERAAGLTFLGTKTGPSGGMVASSVGTLYFGALSNNSVYQWDPSQPLSSRSVLVEDDTTMQWQDALAFDDSGNLLFTTNRLQLFLQSKMTFGPGEINFRVIKVPVGAGSYISAEQAHTPKINTGPTCPQTYSNVVVALAVLAGIELLMLFCCTGFLRSHMRDGTVPVRKAAAHRTNLAITSSTMVVVSVRPNTHDVAATSYERMAGSPRDSLLGAAGAGPGGKPGMPINGDGPVAVDVGGEPAVTPLSRGTIAGLVIGVVLAAGLTVALMAANKIHGGADWVSGVVSFMPIIVAQLTLGIPGVQKALRERLWKHSPRRVWLVACPLVACWLLGGLILGRINVLSLIFVTFLVGGVLGACSEISASGRGLLCFTDLALWVAMAAPLDLRWFEVYLWEGIKGSSYDWWAITLSIIIVMGFGIFRKLDFYRLVPRLRDLWVALAAFVGMAVIVIPTGLGLKFLKYPPTHPITVEKVFGTWFGNVVGVGIIEELFFRCLLYQGLARLLPDRKWWIATLLSSFAFGMWHWVRKDDWDGRGPYMLLAFLAGIFYCLAFRYSGNNILAAVLVHSTTDTVWGVVLT